MAGNTFQKFKSSLNRGVTAISLKTSSSLEKAKIKTHIESIKSEIDRLIVSSGEAAYTIWESGETDFSALNEAFEAIKQKKEEITQLEKEYDSIDERDSQILGVTPAEEAPPAPAAPQVEGIVCSNCGASYTAAVKFCRKCGNKLQD